MIGALRGVLTERMPRRDGTAVVTVDVNGVGYEVTIGARHFRSLPALRSDLEMSVHTHLREGAITLYGFSDRSERELFDLLLSAHGVGPAMALSILGSLAPGDLIEAVRSGDVKALTAVPGVGTKTAQRIILELGQKFEGGEALALIGPAGGGGEAPVRLEVVSALEALGYGPDEIRSALRGLSFEGTVEVLLREALYRLAPRG